MADNRAAAFAAVSSDESPPTLVIPDRGVDQSPDTVPFPFPARGDSSPSPATMSFPSSPRSPVHSFNRSSPASRPSPSPAPAPLVRPTFMRQRQTSLPASLVQSRHYSLVGSSGLSATALGSAGGGKRISVASFASFDSLPEEGEGGDDADDTVVEGRAGIVRRSLSPPATRRGGPAKRSSLPPGGHLSRGVSVVRQRTLSRGRRAPVAGLC